MYKTPEEPKGESGAAYICKKMYVYAISACSHALPGKVNAFLEKVNDFFSGARVGLPKLFFCLTCNACFHHPKTPGPSAFLGIDALRIVEKKPKSGVELRPQDSSVGTLALSVQNARRRTVQSRRALG